MLLQTILQISIFVFLSSRQFCQSQCVDQTGVITNGKTCVQLLASDCYDATFLSNCCQTCKAFYTGATGCEYGDKVANCIVPLCPYYSDPNECCATCKVTTTAAPTPSTSATTTIPTLATTTKATTSTTTTTLATTILTPTLATTAPTTSFISTTTTKPTITTTPKLTIAATTSTTSKTIATVKAYTSTTSSSQVPVAPSESIVFQTTNNITLKVTLQAGSTANQFEITASTGVAQKIPLPAGNVSVEYVFNTLNDSGTCFTLQIVTTNAAGISPVTTLSNACYAPKRPQVNVVETTIKNIRLNISVPSDSFAKSFQIRRTGDTAKTVDFPSDNTSVFYLFESPAQAGTCFTFEIVAIAAVDRARSSVFAINNTCYASFPVFPGSLSAEEKMIVAVSSVGGFIFVSCAAAVLCILAMKRKEAQQNTRYSPSRHHGNHRLRSHRYGNHQKIPDYFGTYYPTHAHSYNYQRYNLNHMTNNGNIQDYTTSQVYNWWQLTPLKTLKTYR